MFKVSQEQLYCDKALVVITPNTCACEQTRRNQPQSRVPKETLRSAPTRSNSSHTQFIPEENRCDFKLQPKTRDVLISSTDSIGNCNHNIQRLLLHCSWTSDKAEETENCLLKLDLLPFFQVNVHLPFVANFDREKAVPFSMHCYTLPTPPPIDCGLLKSLSSCHRLRGAELKQCCSV